jgi:drug/metabolite transporter (DMT)-like permease
MRYLSMFSAFLFIAGLHAQTRDTGAIFGAVIDAQGAAIPGAIVVLTSTATGQARRVEASSSGQFTYASLPVGVYTLTVGAGLAFAPVAYASAFTQGVLPLTTAVMAVIVLKEKLTAWRKIGIVLIIAGAVMIAGLGLGDFGGRESIGQAIFLSATLLWAAYTVALRKARLDGLHATAIACVASLIIYIPIYLALFGPRVLAAPWRELVWQGLYQGVLTGVVSLVLFGRAVALLGASAAGAFIALGPVIATLLAIPILNEWPTAEDWIGIAVISAGVYLASGGPLPRRLLDRAA